MGHSSIVAVGRGLLRIAIVLLPCASLGAQEIRGIARLDAGGEVVDGASVTLIDSLGHEAATARTDRKGAFLVKAPTSGTYWLQMSARGVGRNASPVFVLDSGITLFYEHAFRQSLSARVRGEVVTAETVLSGALADSSSGHITRGLSSTPIRQVRVTVVDDASGKPVPQAEVALVAIDPRFEQVVGGATDSTGRDGWRDVNQTWYRVVSRRLGFEAGGTHSFPIVGDADSVSVILRLKPVTVLDEVKVMAQHINAFGFNINLLNRYYLGGDSLRARTRSAVRVDDLIRELRIPGLGLQTASRRSQTSTRLRYRGEDVRVFILDGSRTSGEMPMIEAAAVESLMFIPPNEAGAVFGTDSKGGVLIINTRIATRK